MLSSFSLLSHIAFRGPSIPLLVDMTICILGFVCTPVFRSLGSVPQSGIAGAYSNSVFNYLRSFPILKAL